MPIRLNHALAVESTKDEASRQDFATSMRKYVLGPLAGHMRAVYENRVEPNYVKSYGKAPEDGKSIHKVMKNDTIFKFYSAIRTGTQEMVWHSVLPSIDRYAKHLADKVDKVNSGEKTLHLDPKFDVPRYLSALDIHLMPGCYDSERFSGDVTQGALYDNGLSVFLMGFLGPEMDDTGRTASKFIKSRFPDFKPKRMLDIGATIGFNTLPWSESWPDLEIHAIDPAAPNVRYGHARCKNMGKQIHFHQMDGAHLNFEDDSFDIVWSAMVLHEMPTQEVLKLFKESYRVLKPGGLMLHMELPLNADVEPYEQFYIDWDSYYNKEPFYKSLRDLDVKKKVLEAGFNEDKFVRFVIPSNHNNGSDAVINAAQASEHDVAGNVGRLEGGLQWFTFGAWK